MFSTVWVHLFPCNCVQYAPLEKVGWSTSIHSLYDMIYGTGAGRTIRCRPTYQLHKNLIIGRRRLGYQLCKNLNVGWAINYLSHG